MRPIITLTTDFGLADAYVGTMRGVIAGICPEARVIDLTHGVPAFDVLAGALALSQACVYFPAATIHVAVVDPGVGSSRRPVLVASGGQFFIAPDNGLLSLALQSDTDCSVRQITNPEVMLPRQSATFHGRDVFAPAAAHLANMVAEDRVELAHFGTELGPEDLIRVPIPKVERHAHGALKGVVLRIDHFGNCITNIGERDLDGWPRPGSVRVNFMSGTEVREKRRGHTRTLPLLEYYSAVAEGSPLALVGSSGLLEFAVNGGSAAKEFPIARGDAFVLHRE